MKFYGVEYKRNADGSHEYRTPNGGVLTDYSTRHLNRAHRKRTAKALLFHEQSRQGVSAAQDRRKLREAYEASPVKDQAHATMATSVSGVSYVSAPSGKTRHVLRELGLTACGKETTGYKQDDRESVPVCGNCSRAMKKAV